MPCRHRHRMCQGDHCREGLIHRPGFSQLEPLLEPKPCVRGAVDRVEQAASGGGRWPLRRAAHGEREATQRRPCRAALAAPPRARR
eukprot:36603-Chlamydomonas_euryale.AAC.1